MPLSGGDAQPVVSCRGVSIGYENHPVLTGLDFTLARGEVVAVLGPNGSGKSTLIRGMLGLAQILAGQLELFGIPAASFRDRQRLGYVPQRHTVAAGYRSPSAKSCLQGGSAGSGRGAASPASITAPSTARSRPSG